MLGATLNLLNMVLDTAGSVLTRRYGANLTTFQINLVRFGAASAMTAMVCLAAKGWSAVARPEEPPPQWAAFVPRAQPMRAWLLVGSGALLVTFLCPLLSNYALFGLPLGVWTALGSLGPVWSVPVLFLIKGERTGARGIAGAGLAVAGAASLAIAAL